MKKSIALLYGGAGSEHDVSVLGYEYVKRLLKNSGFDVCPVYIDRSGNWHFGEGTVFPYRRNGRGILLTDNGLEIPIDAAVPLLHGDMGEGGEIQGAMTSVGIPFIGADVSTGAVCLDKHYTKCIAKELNIPVTRWVSFQRHTDTETALKLCETMLSFPIFIKPRRLGSSFGAYPIYDREEFRRVFPEADRVSDGLMMAEELLENKRELECAFYSVRGTTVISAPGEILNDGFYGYKEKYVNSAKTATVADVDENIKETIKKYSLLLADACCLRHLARIDYFLTDEGVVFNEINTFPGFTEKSLYPKMIEAAGIAPGDAMKAFIKDAIGC